ncbi:MAG: hypothetical protein FJY88_07525 [Candidatus Eisenbacteria bacterium]|nr:hypothetical protein [Candidatus Eisenbacteria bacterium]
MRRRRIPILIAAAACAHLLAPAAHSYRQPENRGAVLYLSIAPEQRYDDTTSFRGRSATPTPEEAIVSDVASPRTHIAYLLLAYPPEAVPEMSVVSYGIRYPNGIRIVRYGISPNCLQMATRDWPSSREGMMLGVIGKPDTNRVVELGWFAIQATKPGRVEVVPHPDAGMAARIVSQTSSLMTPIADFGHLGFDLPGRAPAPTFPGPVTGAACYHDSVCVELTRAEAEYYGDAVLYLEDGLLCQEGTLCWGPLLEGACCLPDGACRILTRKACAKAAGKYQGNYSRCDPDPCGAQAAPTAGEEGK